MKKVFVEEKGKVNIRDVQIPHAEEGTIVVKIEVATICGQTDLNIIEGLHPGATPFPCVLGHEGAGIVEEVGKGVNNFKVGDRVAVRSWSGGTFAEFLKIRLGVDDIIKIPQNMSFEEASLLEITSCVFALVNQCVNLGEDVIVLGLGTAGLIAIQLSKASGAINVLATSRSEMKRDLALSLGADLVINSREKDIVKEVLEMTEDKGVDVVLECAGFPSTISACPKLVKQQGTIGLFGACVQPVLFDFLSLHMKWCRIITTGYKWAYSRETFEKHSVWIAGK